MMRAHSIFMGLLVLATLGVSCGVSKEIAQVNEATVQDTKALTHGFFDNFPEELQQFDLPKMRLWRRSKDHIDYVTDEHMLHLTPFEKLDEPEVEFFQRNHHYGNYYESGKALYIDLIFKFYAIHHMAHLLQRGLDVIPSDKWEYEVEALTITVLYFREKEDSLNLEAFMTALEGMQDNIAQHLDPEVLQSDMKALKMVDPDNFQESWYRIINRIFEAKNRAEGQTLQGYLQQLAKR